MTSFLTPLMFAFAATLPVIVALYLLKLRRQRLEVPSTLLWMKSIQDLTANAPFQRLRNNLLLWLQLLIAALAVLALARPFLNLDTTRNQTLIVLIDNSASMQATDVEGFDSRLAQARAMALELIDNLGPGDAMLPAVFNSRTQTLVSSATDDRAALRRAVLGIAPTDRPTDIRDAMMLVRSLVDHVSNPEIAVISDGALGDMTDDLLAMARDDDGPPVRYLRCGTGGENLGITAFSLSRALEDQRRVELYAEVLNASANTVEIALELLLDGERIDAKTIALEPEQSRGVVFTNVGDIAGAVTLRLHADDDLAVDNVAHGVLGPQRDLRALLVSDRDNPFMTQILTSQAGVDLARVSAVDLDIADAAERFDLIILDNFCPATLPDGNYLIFGATLPIEGFTAAPARLEYPPVVDWHRTSPLTRFANFSLITVADAIDFTPPAHAQTLIETNHGPLVCLIERGARSILYAGFDLYQSDWPWLVSFPIFLTNAVEHFRGRAGTAGQFAVATGDALVIPLRRDTEAITLTAPDADAVALDFAPGTPTCYFTNTDRAGIYTVADDAGRTVRHAASLLSPAETSILPAAEIGEPGRGLAGETEVIRANTEIWWPLVWAVLAVLCLEWFIYLRRTWL